MGSFLKEIGQAFSNLSPLQKGMTLAAVVLLAGMVAILFLSPSPESSQKKYKDLNQSTELGQADIGYRGNRFFTRYISFVPPTKPEVELNPAGDTGEDLAFSINGQFYSMVVYPASYFRVAELVCLSPKCIETGKVRQSRRPGFFIGSPTKAGLMTSAGRVGNYVVQMQSVTKGSRPALVANTGRIISTMAPVPNGS